MQLLSEQKKFEKKEVSLYTDGSCVKIKTVKTKERYERYETDFRL